MTVGKSLWVHVHPKESVAMDKATGGRILNGLWPPGKSTEGHRHTPKGLRPTDKAMVEEITATLNPVAQFKGTRMETAADLHLICCNPQSRLHVTGIAMAGTTQTRG